MNKIKLILSGMLVACIGLGIVNAQDQPAKQTPAKTSKTPTAKKRTTTTKTSTAKSAPAGQHLKKDGTPDKRYKENKGAPAKKASTATPAKTDDGAKPAKKGTGKKKGGAKKPSPEANKTM